MYCQSRDMADFHVLLGKLEPLTLNSSRKLANEFSHSLRI